MNWKEADLPALRELESTVVRLWGEQPEMNDYTAGRAYEAAYQLYRARLRGQEPKPVNVSGLDREAYEAVQQVCEKLLTTGATPLKGAPDGNTNPLTLEKLLEYLRELMRSVERHTKLGGRLGYLAFVRSFIP
jgi:hypothetical protein